MVCDQGTEELNFLVGVISKRMATFKLLGLQGDPQSPSLVAHPDLTINKTLRRVLDPLSVMVLKRVSENIFFQINKPTACKFKDKK